MSFRARLTLAAALSVALAIALAAPAVYAIVRGELRGEVDNALRSRATAIAQRPLRQFTDENGNVSVQLPHEPPGGSAGYVQYVSNTGDIGRPEGEPYPLPASRAGDVASG